MSAIVQKIAPGELSGDVARYAHHIVGVDGYWPPQPSQKGVAKVALEALFTDQREVREGFGERVNNVVRAERREINIGDGNVVTAQLNTGRKRKPGTFDPSQRPCFLEPDVIAADEKELVLDGLIVGYTPMPILYQHGTAMYPNHSPQSLQLMLSPAINITRMLGRNYFTYYNGPKVGASAPDHAHVQLAEHHELPIERDLLRKGKGEAIYRNQDAAIYIPEGLGRAAILIDGSSAESITRLVRAVVGRLAVHHNENEPRLNMTVRHFGEPDGEGITRVMIFPREEATPPYLSEGSRPATLEMAGILVVTDETDYQNLSASRIREMYAAASTPRDEVLQRLANLSLAA